MAPRPENQAEPESPKPAKATTPRPASIDAYLGVRDALRLYEVAPIVGIRRGFTHRKMHELGIPHYHADGPHTEAEIDSVKGGIVPVRQLAAWLEGRAA